MKMPEYFLKKGHMCPNDSTNCGFQWALGTNLTYFEHIQNDPSRRKDFDTFMSGNRINRKHWVDWFPVESELLTDVSSDKENHILLVDVGGNRGHDLKRFLDKYPACSGRLVLQDLPGVVSNAKGLEGIEIMAHDFFTLQPVKGMVHSIAL